MNIYRKICVLAEIVWMGGKHRGVFDWYKTGELGLQFSVPVSWIREQILKRGDAELSYD